MVVIASLFALAQGQQVSDTTYKPYIAHPSYPPGQGPLIYIDEGHNNFHTRGDRYLPFALLLEQDGYITEGYMGQFETARLSRCRIMVISNALHETNITRWHKPVLSAFTAQLAGPQQVRVGMNSPYAANNFRLLLNIIRWLDGR